MTDNQLPNNPESPIFWDARYQQGYDGWDIGQPAPPFVDLLSQQYLPRGYMIALGCGRGHDAIFFAQQSFRVTGVDFSPIAIRDAKEAARRAGVKVAFVEHDIFALPSSYNQKFNYVLEHTCFAAIPPHRRAEYVSVVRRLLKPRRGRYIALFFAHGQPGGPPFNTTDEEIRELFSPYFIIERLEPPSRSVEQRQGQEIFALMRLKQPRK